MNRDKLVLGGITLLAYVCLCVPAHQGIKVGAPPQARVGRVEAAQDVKQPTEADYVDPINNYLANTPMAGTGTSFMKAERTYGVRHELLMSIAYAETNYDRNHQRGCQPPICYNPFSIGSYDSTNSTEAYHSYDEAVMAAADVLTNPKRPIGAMRYRALWQLSSAGNTTGPRWAMSTENWQRNTSEELTRITGRPVDATYDWRTTP